MPRIIEYIRIERVLTIDHPDNAGKQRAAAPYEYWIYEDGVAKWAWLGGSGTSRLLPYSLDADKQYTFRVKVKSKDIRQWYHSDWSEFSSPLDTGETTEPIATTLENILQSLENGTLSSADARLKMSRLDKEDFLVALQSNVRLWDTISEIERIYMEKQNITGEVEIAPEFAGKLEGDVRIIGAGMNTSGKRFSLKIGDGKNQVTVPNRFTQYVHLSIELEGPPQPHQLFDLPIRITMPIPKPLRPQSLYLLHYKDEDPTQFEMVRLEHNGDGTVSFTLSHLSDFVFASEEAPDLYEIQVTGGRSYLEDGTAVGKAAAGKKVTLKADGAAEGKEFDRWIVVKGQITLADEKDETTTFTMPSEDVAVRALWKDKTVTPDGGKSAPDEKIGASKKPGSTVSSTPKTEDGADRSLGMGLILASLLILLSTAFVGGKEM